MWHKRLAMAVLSDKVTRQTIIPEDRIYDDVELFSEICEGHFGEDIRKILKKHESNNFDENGPGKSRCLDDRNEGTLDTHHATTVRNKKLRKRFTFHKPGS